MKRLLLIMLMLCLPLRAYATEQFPDKIILDGSERELLDMPLAQQYDAHQRLQNIIEGIFPGRACSGLWRRYVATWQVREAKLWLTKIDIGLCFDLQNLPLSRLFPDSAEPVSASWFSDKLFIPDGKLTGYTGFRPRYDRYIVLTIEKGVIIRQEVKTDP